MSSGYTASVQRLYGMGMTDTGAYTVDAHRAPRGWVAEIRELPHVRAQAGSLESLDKRVREAIAAATDRTEGVGLVLAYDYHVGPPDLGGFTAELRGERAELADAEHKLNVRTAAAAHILARQLNVGVRDVAVLLGVSASRISQLAPQRT